MLSHMRDKRANLVRRVSAIVEQQRTTGHELRAALDECIAAGMSWREIGAAVGIPFQTLQRQYAKGGPIVLQVGGPR